MHGKESAWEELETVSLAEGVTGIPYSFIHPTDLSTSPVQEPRPHSVGHEAC